MHRFVIHVAEWRAILHMRSSFRARTRIGRSCNTFSIVQTSTDRFHLLHHLPMKDCYAFVSQVM